MKPFSFYLLTDTHYFEQTLGAEGKAFDEYMKREQYFMKESDAIIESVFKKIAEDKETDIVIIPGDLTKNGEKESHTSFIKHLYKLKESGKKIYVITAGHDYNEYSFGYKNDERIVVEGTSFDELYDMYYDFGYSDALEFDKRTHSYITEIVDGVRMLAINCDSFNNPKGAMDDELISWAKVQLDKAKEDGCSVFAICHYPVIPSLPVFDLVGDAKIKQWRKVASFLADNGVELILTGHMHIQSINEYYSEKGNRLIDICTSCLVGSPAKYRKITVDEKSVMKVESIGVDCFDQEYFDKQFGDAIVNRISNALSGGKGIVKLLKKLEKKIYKKATLGALSRLLWIKIDKSLRKKKLTELVGEIGLAIFAGDQPYVEGTPEYDMIFKALKRFSFIIKKFEPKLEKDGIKVNLTEMIINTIGNNKGYSDLNTEFILK
ncbi:MAG: metallophosphoesterase [Clostridia bacterium]|nr:metallophosphoesterase [Clostridia bacterium]